MIEFIAYQGVSFTVEWFYSKNTKSQALEFFLELNEEQQDKFLYLLKRIGDTGKINDKTKFRSEGEKIFAFKPKPDRFLCFFQQDKKIIITNGFHKTKDKLPKKEKERAIENMKDYFIRIKTGEYYEKLK